jgi:1-acyl-sn-glycerol-3-phosphate acyltransferase
MLATVVAAVRSVIAYLITLVYIAVVGPIGLFVGLVLRWKRGLYALGHAGTWLALRTAGIRYRVVGRDQIPDGAVVFCANHESNVDPPVLSRRCIPGCTFSTRPSCTSFR